MESLKHLSRISIVFLLLTLGTAAEDIIFSTVFGGELEDHLYDFCTDNEGSLIFQGRTNSADSLPLLNAADSTYDGMYDAIVVKFNSNRELVFSTYLGGSNDEYGYTIATDQNGNTFACGSTGSPDFYCTPDAQNNVYDEGEGYIAKYSPQGDLLYSSYFGGSPGGQGIRDVAIDDSGYIYIVGNTMGPHLPISLDAYQPTYGGGDYDGYLAKLSNDCKTILYCTYFGGSSLEEVQSVTVDSDGNIYIGGHTSSDESTFPLVNAYDGTLGAHQDAFIAKFSPTFIPIYSTYLGGDSTASIEYDDGVQDICADTNGNLYVVGHTYCFDFPLVNPLYDELDNDADGYISILSADGSSLLFSTYWGFNSNYDNIVDIEIDTDGYIYICGTTKSTDMPLVCPYDSTCDGFEGMLTKLSPMGAEILLSSYFGGNYVDGINGIALYDNYIYMGGNTSSDDIAYVMPYDSTVSNQDALLIIIEECSDSDCDWICVSADNCPSIFNPDQADIDDDSIGDICDNCPAIANTDQLNSDNDSLGNVCDNCPELDNDDQADNDGDNIGDICDNCPTIENTNQQNSDGDSHGDVCDNCPNDDNELQENSDLDSYGNACDNCPDSTNEDQADSDLDDIGNVCDNCIDVYNPDQEDTDTNGVGDSCEVCDCEPGNVNLDVTINIFDITYLISYLYLEGSNPQPYELCNGDMNGDCVVNIFDITGLIAYLYLDGSRPRTCEEWVTDCGLPLRY